MNKTLIFNKKSNFRREKLTAYILLILGIVMAGIVIDVIVPSGTINKYVKSIFSIFVLAVILMPVVKFISTAQNVQVDIGEQKVNETLLNYIFRERISSMEKDIAEGLNKEGFKNIDIIINYSIKDNELSINSCEVNLKKLEISASSQHINKYEFIIGFVKERTNLTDEVIIFNE